MTEVPGNGLPDSFLGRIGGRVAEFLLGLLVRDHPVGLLHFFYLMLAYEDGLLEDACLEVGIVACEGNQNFEQSRGPDVCGLLYVVARLSSGPCRKKQ